MLAPGATAGTFGDAVVGPGTGDNMGAALGLGLQEGDVAISLGTSGTVFAVAGTPTSDASGAVAGFADATGRFLPLACTLNATKVTDAMARLLGRSRDEFEQLALACPPGAGGVVLLPYLDGERTPNLPDATGTLAGLRSDTEPAQLARAAYEGVVCGLLDALDALGDAGVPTDRGPPGRRRRRCALRRVPAAHRRSPAAAGRGRCRPPSTWRAARASRPPPPSPATTSRPSRASGRRATAAPSSPTPPSTPRACAASTEICSNALIPSQETHVIRTSFNDDWRVRPKVNAFAELMGGGAQPWVPVRLPHDAMIGGDADPPVSPPTATSPAGCGSTRRPSSRRDRPRQADPGRVRGRVPERRVYVNGTLVGHRPYGYSNFAVSIGEHLRYGAENTISVEATAHRDSRWYSGAGIYRDVHLVVGEPVHVALDGVHVTTPESTTTVRSSRSPPSWRTTPPSR